MKWCHKQIEHRYVLYSCFLHQIIANTSEWTNLILISGLVIWLWTAGLLLGVTESAQLSEHIIVIGFVKKSNFSSSPPAPCYERTEPAYLNVWSAKLYLFKLGLGFSLGISSDVCAHTAIDRLGKAPATSVTLIRMEQI